MVRKHSASLQTTLQPKPVTSEVIENEMPLLKERLFETEQALRGTTRKLEDLQGEYGHITAQLQQLAVPDEDASADGQRLHSEESAGHLLSRIKSQLLEMWHEIERLQQVGLPIENIDFYHLGFLVVPLYQFASSLAWHAVLASCRAGGVLSLQEFFWNQRPHGYSCLESLQSSMLCLQERSLHIEEREVLADKLATTDAVMNEQFQRFSAVLLLLSTTLSIPDDLLVAVSDVGADGVDEGMDQVSPSFRDATTCQSDVLMCLKH